MTLHLDCTHDHPVYLLEGVAGEKGSYCQAVLLTPGDRLLGSDGQAYEVTAIEELPAPEFVWNLATEPDHNFFANGVLVHNCDDPIDPKRAVSEAELKTAADFMTNILPSRKVDKAVAVTTLIMQRLHECLIPCTLVRVPEGQKPIEELQIGDTVFGSSGWQKIIAVGQRHYSGQAYGVRLYGHPTVCWTTDNHLYRTLRDWVRADQLTKDDWVFFPNVADCLDIPWEEPRRRRPPKPTGTFNGDGDHSVSREQLIKIVDWPDHAIAKHLGVHRNTVQCYRWLYGLGRVREQNPIWGREHLEDKGFWRVVGYWLAEGSFCAGRGSPSGVRFTFGFSEQNLVDDVATVLGRYQVPVLCNSVPSALNCSVFSSQLARWLHTYFGKGAHGKKLPEFVFGLSALCRRELLTGWAIGDGCVNSAGEIRGSSVNWALLQGFQRLALSLGQPALIMRGGKATVSYIGPCEVRSSGEGGELRFGRVAKLPARQKCLLDSHGCWYRVRNIEQKFYEGPVHDITTPSHNFVVGNATVHNSDPTGVLLEKSKLLGGTDRIRHICLPARLADNVQPASLREKYVNGLMDPDRLPESVLREQEILLGAYAFAGQYMQCLVADTLIRTDHGPVPIDRVRAGDRVLTRNGWRKVCWAGATGITTRLSSALFAGGSVLIGTGNHPVWCHHLGWVSLDALTGGMYTTALSKGGDSWAGEGRPRPKWSSSTGRPTTGPHDNATSRLGQDSASTSPSGFTITVTSPLATTSTTRTATQLTIGLKIWSACLLRSTAAGTPTIRKSVVDFLLKSVNAACPGIRAKKVKSLIEKTVVRHLRNCGTTPPIVITFVLPAENLSNQDVLVENFPSTAPGSATNAVASVPTTRSVLGAKNRSQLVRAGLSPVPSLAGPIGGVPGTKVYDITVEDAHEFFANGILVHNSPHPLSGGLFQADYFNQRVKAAPWDAQRILYVDRAATQDGGCYTAMVLMAKDKDGNFYVENCVHGQWEPDERNRRTRAEALRCRTRYGPHEPQIYIEREGGSSGRDSFKGVARALAGFNVREHQPTGRKEVRAEPWSCQLASRNVYIVEGDWDIENYVHEHVHFPLGRYKDQVDSSSAAFSLLTQQRPAGSLRTYQLKAKKKQGLQIILCSPEQLATLEYTKRCLLVVFRNPQKLKGVMNSVRHESQSGEQEVSGEACPAGGRVAEPGKEVMPAHGLPQVLDQLLLECLPDSPASFQDRWDEVLPEYDARPEQLLLSQAQAKRFWSVVCRHRDPWAEAVVLVDEHDDRLLSVGLACCDGLQLGRDVTLSWVHRESWQAKRDDQAPLPYIYEQIRSARNFVV